MLDDATRMVSEKTPSGSKRALRDNNVVQAHIGRSEAMLRAAGFTVEAHPQNDVYLCRVAPVPYAEFGPAAVYPSKGSAK